MHHRPSNLRPLTLALALALSTGCAAPPPGTAPAATASRDDLAPLRARLQRMLDSVRVARGFTGATLGVALADGRTLALATGMADTARKIPLTPQSMLLSGSIGKTYVVAVVLQLVAEGRLDLDAPVARYLGDLPWYSRLPNAGAITVRQLLNHTSGLVRYEFDPRATKVLREQPMKAWTPEERLSYLLDTRAGFEAGQGWDYSDTNYIVIGMIVERLTGRAYYDELRRRVLEPLALRHTIPSDRPDIPVANGYAGPKNDLGGYDASVVDGRLAVNPQFEWTGGGIASTADDLARWGKLLYEGRAFPDSLLPVMLAGVPSKLGPNVTYGLGVMIRQTPQGPVWGHSGFFPGYASEMVYLPAAKTAVGFQVNQSDPYPRGMAGFAIEVARVAGEAR